MDKRFFVALTAALTLTLAVVLVVPWKHPAIAAQELIEPEQGPAVPVKVLTLEAYSASQAPRFAGRVEAGDSAQLAFRVAGQLQHLRVRMGDRVKAGDVLAELSPTDYQLNVDARQAEYDLAELEARRASTLFGKKLISEDQYDTAQTLLATSRARLEQAAEQLSFCKLKAPFSGAIAFTYAMPSEVVGPQQPILNLQDMSRLEIHFNLPPQYQPLIVGPDKAEFRVIFDLLPGVQLEAEYKEVSMQPDPDTNSYPVTLMAASPENFSARPGMPVTVQLHHPSLHDGNWVLPAEALFERSGDNAHVWRIDDATMTVHRTEVALDAGGALREGLDPGDRIVAAGVDRLQEGQKVRPWVREGGL